MKVLSSSNKLFWFTNILSEPEGGQYRDKGPIDISIPKTKSGGGLFEGAALIIEKSNYSYNKLNYYICNKLQKSQDGQQYHCKHLLTCSAQLEAFQKVLEKMAEKP